jgi:serine/threonine protein kinase
MPGSLVVECRTKRFEQREIKIIAKSILKGLKFAHEKSIVHASEVYAPNAMDS